MLNQTSNSVLFYQLNVVCYSKLVIMNVGQQDSEKEVEETMFVFFTLSVALSM